MGADEMLFYQRDTDADASMDDGFYALHDLNGNVVMLLSHAAAIKEKYYYSPYGTVRAVPYINGDINEDGIVNIYDWSWIANKSGTVMGQDAAYSALGDFDRDGDIDVFDTGVVQGAFGYSAPAAPAGAISAFGNTIGYAGYVWEPNLGGNDSGMYQVRFRWYVPELGRWNRRDPIGYVDALNLYEYVSGQPFSFYDPLGMSGASDWWKGNTRVHGWLARNVYQRIFSTNQLANMTDAQAELVAIASAIVVVGGSVAAWHAFAAFAFSSAGYAAGDALLVATVGPLVVIYAGGVPIATVCAASAGSLLSRLALFWASPFGAIVQGGLDGAVGISPPPGAPKPSPHPNFYTIGSWVGKAVKWALHYTHLFGSAVTRAGVG